MMMEFSGDPFVIAHRGASAIAPENTLSAFAKLAFMGMGWVEFDVFISSDHIPMVFHDDDLRRITGKKGRISDFTCDELQKLDAGSWFSPCFQDEKIPSLDAVLKTLAPHVRGINVEVKAPAANAAPNTVAAIIELIESRYSQLPIWYSSFDEACLQALRNARPNVCMGWLSHRWRKHWRDAMTRLECQTIHINHTVLNEKRVKEMSAEYPVFAYTVNDRNRALQLFDWGVRAVYSDHPDLLYKEA